MVDDLDFQLSLDRDYPNRIDLKLPLDSNRFAEVLLEMREWVSIHRPDIIGGESVPMHRLGHTHMTVWFKDKPLSLLFRLTFSGK